MNGLIPAGLGEIVSNLAASAGQGQWYALVVASPNGVARVATLVEEELRASIPAPVVHLVGQTALHDFLYHAQPTTPDVLLLSGVEDLRQPDWEQINFLRSRLIGDYAVVWVLSSAALRRLQDWAKDLDALLRTSTWLVDETADQLSAGETERRLQVLRQEFALSDQQVIERAERNELPGEPAFVEWLVLLGRGDLLAPR